MKKSLKSLALGAAATVLAGIGVGSMVSSAQAALIQIDDNTDVLSLYVDGVLVTGDGGNISGYLNTIDPITSTERLEFTLFSLVPSAVGIKQYTQMTSTDPEEILTGGLSDIFLYETIDPNLTKITFLSSDTASVLAPPSGFTPSSFNPLVETGDYQTVYRTVLISDGSVVNEFQARSASTPEPSSMLGLFALGTLGAASTLKRKLKPSQSTKKETTKVG